MTTPAPVLWENSHPTIAAQVAHDVAGRIVRGDIAAGTLLTEIGIAQDAGVSRTPVREAMLQLQRWGLVRLMPKKGAIVTAVSVDQVRDLLHLRAMLEGSALDAAMAHPEQRASLVTGLHDSVRAQAWALANADLTRFSHHDVDFHLRLIAANDNGVIDEVMVMLAPRLARVIHDVVRRSDDARELLDDHERIVQLIAAGDGVGARGLIETHIARSPALLAAPGLAVGVSTPAPPASPTPLSRNP